MKSVDAERNKGQLPYSEQASVHQREGGGEMQGGLAQLLFRIGAPGL